MKMAAMIDTERLADDLELAWLNHDLGDVFEILTALRKPGEYGLDYRA